MCTQLFDHHNTECMHLTSSHLFLIIYKEPMKDFIISMCQEEQAGFTMEQIFNCRVLVEKHLHQRDLFHNFIDFKKAFKRVWHDGLWHVLRGFKGSFRSSRPSMNTSAALFSSTTSWENYSKQQLASGRDTCSPQYYSTCSWKQNMQDTIQDHHTSISIGGRPLCDLRFADDIDLMGGSSNELQDLTNILVAKECLWHGSRHRDVQGHVEQYKRDQC